MVSKLNLRSRGTRTSTPPPLTSAKGPGVDYGVGGVELAKHRDDVDDELEVVRAEGDGGGLDGLGSVKKGGNGG